MNSHIWIANCVLDAVHYSIANYVPKTDCRHILANKQHDIPNTKYDKLNLVVSTLFLNKCYLRKYNPQYNCQVGTGKTVIPRTMPFIWYASWRELYSRSREILRLVFICFATIKISCTLVIIIVQGNIILYILKYYMFNGRYRCCI